jgi:signal transduction histidine kinase
MGAIVFDGLPAKWDDTRPVSDSDTVKKIRGQLDQLASHLDEVRNLILQRWRTATENTPELTVASSLTRVHFNDHIPGVLDAYSEKLRVWPDKESKLAKRKEDQQVKEHGLQRWQQGYQLRELTREWGHLQMCLLEELESYALARPELEPAAMSLARKEWSRLCWDGISESTTQYWQLHQTEATSHVRELEEVLVTLNELDQARADTWREATHDLQGGLSVVTNASSVLDHDNIPESTRAKFADLLQRGVASLQDMLTDLMSLARLDAGLEQRTIAPFDAAEMLAAFCRNSAPLAEQHGLSLETEGPASMMVEGDRVKIQRILQNLLLNALKYTEHGGVKVVWGFGTDRHAKGWMFCVQDTGPGLHAGTDAPVARQIFEATQSAHAVGPTPRTENATSDAAKAPTLPAQSRTLSKNRQPGEGVGLSIVKRLCELLDASLELTTRPGEGSTFRVIFPVQYAAESAQAAKAS